MPDTPSPTVRARSARPSWDASGAGPRPGTTEDDVWQQVRSVLTDPMHIGAVSEPALVETLRGDLGGRVAVPRQRLGRVAALLQRVELDVLAVNDVVWDEIVAIEPDGVEQVYDATVLGTHNFVANGIAVHNSIEQDADMVILLHREDMYEKESPRAGEADFIVAKHRNGPTATISTVFQGHYSRFVDMQR